MTEPQDRLLPGAHRSAQEVRAQCEQIETPAVTTARVPRANKSKVQFGTSLLAVPPPTCNDLATKGVGARDAARTRPHDRRVHQKQSALDDKRRNSNTRAQLRTARIEPHGRMMLWAHERDWLRTSAAG